MDSWLVIPSFMFFLFFFCFVVLCTVPKLGSPNSLFFFKSQMDRKCQWLSNGLTAIAVLFFSRAHFFFGSELSTAHHAFFSDTFSHSLSCLP